MRVDNRGTTGREVIPSEVHHSVELAAFRVLARAESLADAAPQILGGVGEALGWDVGALWTLDDSAGVLVAAEIWTRDEPRLVMFANQCREKRFERGYGLPGRVWETGDAIWMTDVLTDRAFRRGPLARAAGLRGAFGFPIFVGGEFYGVMEFLSSDVEERDQTLLDLIATLSRQIGNFIERDRVRVELNFQKALLEYQSEAALDGIGVIAPDMRILYWNQRILDMFDIRREEVDRGDARPLIEDLIGRTADAETVREFANRVISNPDAAERLEIEMLSGRTIDLWTAPIRGPEGAIFGRAMWCRDITDQRRAAARLRYDEEWTNFIAEATNVLNRSLDVEAITERLAKLAVPRLGDWCSIHMVDETGAVKQVAVAHVDPAKVEIAWQLQERYPPDPTAEPSVYSVIRSREPVLLPEIPQELLERNAPDEGYVEIVRQLDLRSALIVPIVARDRALGAITLVGAESGRRYDESDVERARDLAARAAFPIDNARLYQDSQLVARTLQKSFLPPQLPDVPGIDLSARYFAAGEGGLIGGDFYDAFRIDSKRWGLVLGDVSGKGLEAATVTTLARHTIRGAALTAQQPSEALHVLNAALLEQQQTDRFCTAVYAIVEPRFARVRVTIACGGHPAPYVIRNDGAVEPVEVSGTLLGFMDGVSLRDVNVELEFGDKLFLYTDGLLDIRQKGGTFGPEGLEKLLYECSKRGTESAADYVASAVAELQAGRSTDDIAYIVAGVRSSVFNVRRRASRDEG